LHGADGGHIAHGAVDHDAGKAFAFGFRRE
jgi:hypothetical protein